MTAPKILKRRDSATAILKKMGISREGYDKYIASIPGGFTVDVASAQRDLEAKRAPASTQAVAKPVKEKKPATSKIVVKGGDKRTVSSVARELIKAGKSNKEVWELLKAEFSLDDSKKHYPSWYRSQIARTEGKK